jgi:hypothetical protein
MRPGSVHALASRRNIASPESIEMIMRYGGDHERNSPLRVGQPVSRARLGRAEEQVVRHVSATHAIIGSLDGVQHRDRA